MQSPPCADTYQNFRMTTSKKQRDSKVMAVRVTAEALEKVQGALDVPSQRHPVTSYLPSVNVWHANRTFRTSARTVRAVDLFFLSFQATLHTISPDSATHPMATPTCILDQVSFPNTKHIIEDQPWSLKRSVCLEPSILPLDFDPMKIWDLPMFI